MNLDGKPDPGPARSTTAARSVTPDAPCRQLAEQHGFDATDAGRVGAGRDRTGQQYAQACHLRRAAPARAWPCQPAWHRTAGDGPWPRAFDLQPLPGRRFLHRRHRRASAWARVAARRRYSTCTATPEGPWCWRALSAQLIRPGTVAWVSASIRCMTTRPAVMSGTWRSASSVSSALLIDGLGHGEEAERAAKAGDPGVRPEPVQCTAASAGRHRTTPWRYPWWRCCDCPVEGGARQR